MTKQDSFIKGTFVGLILGLIGGILLAPSSGEDTRREIKRRGLRLAGDIGAQAERLQGQLGSKVEQLRQVAQDLGQEAREESQSLIARAEVMKQDLSSSTKSIAGVGRKAKDETLTNVRQLVDESAALMSELEDVTKRLVRSAKDKLRRDQAADQAAIARIEELERNGSAGSGEL